MNDRQSITTQVAQEMSWWTSIELNTQEKIQHSPEAEAILSRSSTLATQIDYQYEETAAGERRQTTLRTYKDGRVERVEDYFDGRKAATVEFSKEDSAKQTRVTKSGSFAGEQSMGGVNRPTPLKYFHVGKIPLYEALEKARDMGVEEISSTPCVKYMFDDVVVGQTSQNLLYYLRKQDALPIRIESYQGPDPASSPRLWIWEADQVELVQGHPFVVKSHSTLYNPGSTVVRTSRQFEVKHIAFNKKIGMETFRPVIAPEAAVYDAATGRIQPPARKVPEVDLAPPAATVGLAVPPAGWTPFLTNASYGLGTLLVIVGVVLRFRR